MTDWDVGMAVDERLRQIHAYWDSRRRSRAMPSRGDINPAHIPRLLPYVFLVEILRDLPDFRFRLAGTHFCDFTGMELAGRRIDAVFPPAFTEEVRYHWAGCVARRAPKIGSGRLWLPDREHVGRELTVLQLSAAGALVDMLLGAIVFKIGSPHDS